MSADPDGKPVRRTDDGVPERLSAIDRRLHHISTQLTNMSQLHSQLDQIDDNLKMLIRSLDRTTQ